MPRQEYNWSDGPAQLGPHSLAKHTILREYVENYIVILTRNGTVPDIRLLLIDGFAGGGDYTVKGQASDKVHDGSPVVLIDAVRAADVRVNGLNGNKRQRRVSIDAEFIFIEKKKETYQRLSSVLHKRFDKEVLARIDVIHGSFEEQVDRIIERVNSATGRKPRPIFVLDQYGYASVPVPLIEKIMKALPKAEVFLTLAVDWISAYSRSLKEAMERMRGSLQISLPTKQLVSGEVEFDEVDSLPQPQSNVIMRELQTLLHAVFATQAGARHYTPFFITSRGSNRSYWFLHLANSSRANDEVKQLHWRLSNNFKHFGRDGTRMLLGFDPACEHQLSFDFDDSARARTVRALTEELPLILRDRFPLDLFPEGVSVKELYEAICNETPASKEIVAEPLLYLCQTRELDRSGGKGEQRQSTTRLFDNDRVRIAKQTRFFFLSKTPCGEMP